MDYLADYRESIRMRDKVEQIRTERNIAAGFAIAGWAAFSILATLWVFRP